MSINLNIYDFFGLNYDAKSYDNRVTNSNV